MKNLIFVIINLLFTLLYFIPLHEGKANVSPFNINNNHITRAGAIILTQQDAKIYAILGTDKNNSLYHQKAKDQKQGWSSWFTGKVDVQDKDCIDTIVREVYEESAGSIKLERDEIRLAIDQGAFFYSPLKQSLAVIIIKNVDIKEISDRRDAIEIDPNSDPAMKEMLGYSMVPILELENFIKRINIEKLNNDPHHDQYFLLTNTGQKIRLQSDYAQALISSNFNFTNIINTILLEAKDQLTYEEIRSKAWSKIGVARNAIESATPEQSLKFINNIYENHKIRDKVDTLTKEIINDPLNIENSSVKFEKLKKIHGINSIENLIKAGLNDNTALSIKSQPYLQALIHNAVINTKYLTQDGKTTAIERTIAQTEQRTITNQHIYIATSNITKRINNINFSNFPANLPGVSAGEQPLNSEKRIWTSGAYSSGIQKRYYNSAGYKSSLLGGSIGADLKLNDDTIFGIAYSQIHSKFDYKDQRLGDKSNVKSYIGSLYSQVILNSQIIWNNVISYSQSDVLSNNKRFGTNPIGKYKSKAINIETNVMYQLSKNGLIILPSLGLKCSSFEDDKYTEVGAGIYNMNFSSNKSRSINGTFGTKITSSIDIKNMQISPYINAAIESQLSNKSTKTKTKFLWMNKEFMNNSMPNNSSKTIYICGGGVMLNKNNIELLLDYDIHLMNRYKAHQGTIGIRLAL